jgi:hypothetical protein
MHDQGVVRIRDRGANRAEKSQPLIDRQAQVVAITVDAHAVDVLHDEIRLPVRSSAIDEPRNVRMIQRGERLALRDGSAR